ncbi:MAG: hypothetical protein HY699_09070, partial [Deltaproteobacteria bacterium]|nr:hypothetical protein [Deltaproteobacteria bacterium]
MRAELLGESFDTNDSQSVVLFEPGVDIRLAAGAVDILLRPTAAAGFTDESPDWGIGGSVALAWDPMR